MRLRKIVTRALHQGSGIKIRQNERDGLSNMKNIKSHLESLKSEADSNENAGGQADIDSTFQGGVQH